MAKTRGRPRTASGKSTGIGLQVLKARQSRGLTQAEAAELLGIHPVSLARWELGTRTPRGAARKLVELWSTGEVLS